jgi:thiol-disulfide isomerase/thioredoxin
VTAIRRWMPGFALVALLLGAAAWLDSAFGTGHMILGIATGFTFAAALVVLAFRRIGRIAQRAADRGRSSLKAPAFPEEPMASYDWKVRTLGGDPFPLERVKHEVLFLNFWSIACPPCLAELPSIQQLHDQLAAEGIVFMCIALDGEADRVREAVARNHLTLPIFLLDGDNLPTVFDAEGIPATYLVAADGRIVYQHQGAALWNHPRVACFLRGLLMQDVVRQVVAS